MKKKDVLEKIKKAVNEGKLDYSYPSIFDKAMLMLVDRNDIKKQSILVN